METYIASEEVVAFLTESNLESLEIEKVRKQPKRKEIRRLMMLAQVGVNHILSEHPDNDFSTYKLVNSVLTEYDGDIEYWYKNIGDK